jgi:uncharacterized protein (DUF1697 family)
MTKYVAFLRGIAPSNPNMRNERLRGVFAGLGLAKVRTVISSGNVVFESAGTAAGLEQQIETALWEQLGFHSTTIIRSQEDLERLAGHNPFDGLAHNRETYLLVTFLQRRTEQPGPPPWGNDRPYQIVASYEREVCTLTNTAAVKTPDVMTQLEKWYGKDITSRTWKTVERILEVLYSMHGA